jgi:UDP-glucose 4-epimerase
MRILVTGGAGFIGSHVAQAFAAAGHEVLVIDDLSTGKRANLPAGVDFEQLDVRAPALQPLIEKQRPAVIAHLAAQIDVRKSVADPVFDTEVNVVGTVRLAQAAARADCSSILFASTGGAIYGEQAVFPAPETHPLRPVSPYGTAKLCAEHYLATFERLGGPRACCLRFANVYGPRQDPHGEAGVVAIFARRLLDGGQPVIYGDGGQTRDYVYVEDVARAHLLAVERGAAGTFNIGTGIETDVNRLAELLGRACSRSVAPRHEPERPGEQRRSSVDPGLAAAQLGWQPRVELGDGLARTVEFFRRQAER